jgi:hypothetical protein
VTATAVPLLRSASEPVAVRERASRPSARALEPAETPARPKQARRESPLPDRARADDDIFEDYGRN